MEVFEAGHWSTITPSSNNDGRRRSGSRRHRGIVEGGADCGCDGRRSIVYRLCLLIVVFFFDDDNDVFLVVIRRPLLEPPPRYAIVRPPRGRSQCHFVDGNSTR